MPYRIVDKFAAELEPKLLALLSHSVFNLADQPGQDSYGEQFRTEAAGWPRQAELYSARFHAALIASDPLIQEFTAAVGADLGCKRLAPPLVYRLDPGDFFRCHLDNYLGNIGFTYFINRGWCWDWGGILTMVAPNGASAEPIFPRSGRLVVRDEQEPIGHFVDAVAPWAQRYQYLMIGFGER